MTEPPNIVWITLDSVRADHTTMGGYERNTTPRIDDIAQSVDGKYFGQCFSHGKYTLASTASILTGTYPSRNQAGYEHEVLPSEIPTVPELLSDVGYKSAGFSSNRYVSSETGLARGFDDFTWLHPSTLLSNVRFSSLLGYALNVRQHSAGFQTNPYKHATPYLLNRAVKNWIDSTADRRPSFIYLHYNEPHRPYYPPLPYLDRYTDSLSMVGAEAAEYSLSVHEHLERIVADGCSLSDQEMAALVAMYDSEIKYTDEMVGRAIDYIRSKSDRETIVVVTADHGELFGEYGLLGHKFVLHDELTHVPLVVAGADIQYDGDSLVQHGDIVKTLLDDVGADTEPIQGVNLRSETRDYVVNQDHDTDFSPFFEHNPEYDVSRFHEGEVTSIRTNRYRFHMSDSKSQLYRLPNTDVDVSDEERDVSKELRDELGSWLETVGTPIESSSQGEYSEEMREHLADLGYR